MTHARILLVEDESIVAMDIQHRLEFMGYQVAGWVGTGSQVIPEIERGRPDLVLMDIILQGAMDGIQVAAAIRRQFAIPVIFLTSHVDDDILQRAKETDPFGFVLKPINDPELHTAIELALYKFHDRTERARSQAALEEERNLLRTLIDAFPDSIYVKDASCHFIIGNQTLAMRMGAKHPGELIGKTDFDFYPKEYAARFQEDEQQVLATNKPLINQEQRSIDVEGQVRWLLTSKVPLRNREGQVIGLVGTGRDITARKRQQAERDKLDAGMREMQKLESIGVMAAGVAHDFNNMLMGIQGNVELALMNLRSPLTAGNYLRDIKTSCERAAGLIQQLLAYAGKAQYRMEPLKLSVLIREITQLIRPLLSQKADLQLQLDEQLPLVAADATQIRQVVMNMVINASEALGESPGIIRVETGMRSVDSQSPPSAYRRTPLPKGAYAYIKVTDSGCGMDDATRARMFEPFFTTKFIGRGLGLSVILGIVRNHHGDIQVESELGKGTCFQVLLPCQ